MIHRKVFGVVASAALVIAACGGGTGGSPAPSMVTEVGDGEGAITVLAWPSYVEQGKVDPAVDWMTAWETETGCKATVETFGTSDAAFAKWTADPTRYDIISASGDAGPRLVRGGYVQPVNLELIETYPDIFAGLKDQPWNTFDGVHYGVPHGRGANLLMWRTADVTTPPTKWAEMFDPAGPYAGKYSVYDAPIYIADAAVVLMNTNPELGITNPYALDDTQFAAAIDLLKKQKPAVGEYWNDYVKQITSYTNGDTVLGTGWQTIANYLNSTDVPVQTVKPVEGATGWSDTWMINSKTEHPNCAYKFINHITSPEVNAQIAEYFGEAPGNSKSCALTTNPNHCVDFHAEDEAWWDDVYYWATPETACLDGRTDVECKGFDDWIKAWTEVRSQ
jgi:putative spermidine/putrescine transport system substrate-binding protein